MLKKDNKSNTDDHSRKVTVVVPVYKDWESLSDCLDALIKHLGSRHSVIVVNDCSPIADEIEVSIKSKIKNHKNFFYYRNDSNIGFVKTCNRAVLELDQTDNDILLLNSDAAITDGSVEEMLEVLYLIDRHAVVAPRSDNASISSIAPKYIDARSADDLKKTPNVFNKVKNMLPRYTVAPVGVGFCMLIKREIINNFGLFDEIYGLGYNEENDFCMRINQYGYSCVISNRSYVEHRSSRSFSVAQKKKLNLKNERTLVSRYPYYHQLVQRYLNHYISPIDNFAYNIAGATPRKKILIDLYHFPSAYNGTTKACVSFLKFLSENKKLLGDVEIDVLASKDAAEYHKIDRFGFKIVNPTKIKSVYDLGFSPLQIYHVENLIILNRHCLRIVVSMYDIITVRTNYLLSDNVKLHSLFIDTLLYSDVIITISKFTAKDILYYFNDYAPKIEDKIFPIQLGFPGNVFAENKLTPSENLSRIVEGEKFILLFGNDYKHKAIQLAVSALEDYDGRRIVVIGPRNLRTKKYDTVILKSGDITDADIETLMTTCDFVLFPSYYEGFGIPVLEAANYGKICIAYASEMSDELKEIVDSKGDVRLYSTYNEMRQLVEMTARERDSKTTADRTSEVRSLDDYNRQTVQLLAETLSKDYSDNDIENLKVRWSYFSRVSEYFYANSSSPRFKVALKTEIVNVLRKNPRLLRAALYGYKKSRKILRV